MGPDEARYRFAPGAVPSLTEARFGGRGGSVTVAFSRKEAGRPESFSSCSDGGTLRGTLTSVRALEDPPASSFVPPHPPGAVVRDLEAPK